MLLMPVKEREINNYAIGVCLILPNRFFLFLSDIISSPELGIVVSQCPSSVVRRAASAIALKAYSSYTRGPNDSIPGRKHQGDL